MKSNLIDIRRSFVAEKVNRGNYLLMFCTYVSNVFNIQFEELRNNLMSLSLGLFYFFYIGFCFEKVFTLLLFFRANEQNYTNDDVFSYMQST